MTLKDGSSHREQRILALGDSHCAFWNGKNSVLDKASVLKGVDVERVGPVMAYSLPSKRAESAAAKIDNLLSASTNRYGLIILCFGEIDVRAHVLAFAIQKQVPISEVIDDVADSYSRFVESLVAKYGIPIAVWGPPPSRPLEGLGYIPALPVTGTPIERNFATALLTKALARRCAQLPNVDFFSIFDQLVGFDLRTLPGALHDSNHMSNANMPAALTELRRVLRRLELTHLEGCLERLPAVADAHRVVKVQTIEWTSGNEDESFWLTADTLSAFVVESAIIPAIPDVQGLGALESVAFGEGRTIEVVPAASAAQETHIADTGAETKLLVFKPTKARAIRRVAFTFRRGVVAPDDGSLKGEAAEKLDPTMRILLQTLAKTADLKPVFAHLNAQALLDSLLRLGRGSIEIRASVFAPVDSDDRRFFV